MNGTEYEIIFTDKWRNSDIQILKWHRNQPTVQDDGNPLISSTSTPAPQRLGKAALHKPPRPSPRRRHRQACAGLGQGLGRAWAGRRRPAPRGPAQRSRCLALFAPCAQAPSATVRAEVGSLFISEVPGLCRQFPRAFLRDDLGHFNHRGPRLRGHSPGAEHGLRAPGAGFPPKHFSFYSTHILGSCIRFHLVLNIKPK